MNKVLVGCLASVLMFWGNLSPSLADPTPIDCTVQCQAFANLAAPVQIGTGTKTVATFIVNNTQAATTTFIQFYSNATTPTVGTNVLWQGSCPAVSLCFIPLPAGGLRLPVGAWVAASIATTGTTTSAAGNFAYAAFYNY